MLINWLNWGAIALLTILWVELVRDSYHCLSHYWKPLYRLHQIHHRVFRPDLSVMDQELYRRSQWQNDVPECGVMLVSSFFPWLVVSEWVSLTGTIYTLGFLWGAIARGSGLSYADELTDLTHRE